jgi:hypothetical protein
LLLLGSVVAAILASPQFDPNWSRLPSGTEIPELRTPTSRTYSNGDGTFTADITPAGETESIDSCQPTSTGCVEYFDTGHGDPYSRGGPELVYGFGTASFVAYAKFDLTSVPDSSRVLSAQFRCYQYVIVQAPVRNRCTYPDLDPDSAGDPALYSAILNGLVLAEAQCDSIGWVGYDLSPQGRSILEGRLQQNRATLGIKPVTGQAVAFGIYGDYRQTYLHIVYNTAGMYESRVATLLPPELVFAPNPATGRPVVVRYVIPAGTPGGLTLRDVLGRAPKSFSLNTSGIAHLDLRGLAPGVYMATLDAGGHSASRKLVITR